MGGVSEHWVLKLHWLPNYWLLKPLQCVFLSTNTIIHYLLQYHSCFLRTYSFLTYVHIGRYLASHCSVALRAGARRRPWFPHPSFSSGGGIMLSPVKFLRIFLLRTIDRLSAAILFLVRCVRALTLSIVVKIFPYLSRTRDSCDFISSWVL